jgi:hypothetical protein
VKKNPRKDPRKNPRAKPRNPNPNPRSHTEEGRRSKKNLPGPSCAAHRRHVWDAGVPTKSREALGPARTETARAASGLLAAPWIRAPRRCRSTAVRSPCGERARRRGGSPWRRLLGRRRSPLPRSRGWKTEGAGGSGGKEWS